MKTACNVQTSSVADKLVQVEDLEKLVPQLILDF